MTLVPRKGFNLDAAATIRTFCTQGVEITAPVHHLATIELGYDYIKVVRLIQATHERL
jgi:hypothetical protein